MSHHHAKCRREVVLEHFNENVTLQRGKGNPCCDVCSTQGSKDMADCQDQLLAIGKVVKELPNKGEKKVSWMSGFLSV